MIRLRTQRLVFRSITSTAVMYTTTRMGQMEEERIGKGNKEG